MNFLDIFGQLNGPRIERKKLHPMPEIRLLTLCAVICGAESWDEAGMFGSNFSITHGTADATAARPRTISGNGGTHRTV